MGILSLLRRCAAALVAVLFFQSCLPPALLAEALSSPEGLDLTSTERSAAAEHAAGLPVVDILVGDATKAVTSADLLTPAEQVALQQVLTTGNQTLLLDSLGRAVGGTFNLHQIAGSGLEHLVIPSGVTALHDAGVLPELNLTGNLHNAGSLFAISSNSAVTEAVFSAANIFNDQGAILSSVLPGQLTGISSVVSSLSLTLHAVADIINAGTIMSSGNLTATAGGSIINALPSGVSGAQPVMQAMGAVNLVSGAGSIVNSGVISSLVGNINLATLASANLVINNIGGTLEAISGSVNIRDSLFGAKKDLWLSGGDVISRELNVFSGTGYATVAVNELTGVLNVSAGDIAIHASTDNLQVGSVQALGDPTFTNSGSITLGSGGFTPTVAAGQPFVVVAGQNIDAASGTDISTATTSGNGGNIIMVAGADFTTGTGTVTITGRSATGGSIDLSNANSLTTARTGSLSGNGGDVTLIAFADSAGGSSGGTINLGSNFTVSTSGLGSGNNGSFTAIADGVPGAGATIAIPGTGGVASPAINTGTVATGLVGGHITIKAATPNATAGTPVEIDTATATINSGSFDGGAIQDGSLDLGQLTARGRQITLEAGGDISVNSITNTSGSNVVPTILALAGGNITVTGLNIDTSTSFSGGKITMVAGAAFTDDGSTATITGRSGLGGSIDIQSATTFRSKTNSGSGTHSGGDITLIAFADSAGGTTGGTVSSPAATEIQAHGRTGNNGDIIIVAEAASGAANSISVGALSPRNTAVAGAVGTGKITLLTASPNVSATPTISRTTAAVTGSFEGGAIQSASLSTGALVTSGAPVLLAAGRDISLASVQTDIAPAGAFLAFAGGNIGVTGTTINTRSGTTGAPMVMVAGAQFTYDGADVSVSGRSGLGGSISAPNVTTFASNTTNGSAGTGGAINLIAFADSAGGSSGGSISVNTAAEILSNGRGTGSNGDIVIIAESSSGAADAITLGAVSTRQASISGIAGTGSLSIKTATPETATPVTVSAASGALTGSFDGGTVRNGAITTGNLKAQSATDLRVLSSSSVSTGEINGFGARVALAAGGDLTVSGSVLSAGGSIVALSRRSITTTGASVSTAGNPAGGNIAMIAGADFSFDGSDFTVSGRSGLGGSISAPNVTLFESRTTIGSGNGTGGSVNLIAFAESAGGSTGGTVSVNTAVEIRSEGRGTGSNGDIAVIAEASTGAANAITLGAVSTRQGSISGAAGTGSLIIKTATPNNSSPVTISAASGALTGSFDGGVVRQGAITTGNLKSTSSADLRLSSSAQISTGEINAFAGNVLIAAGGNLNVNGNLLNINGVFTGTVVALSRQSISVTGTNVDNSSTGNGGNIVLIAGADFTDDGSSFSVSGRSGLGGGIDLSNATTFRTKTTAGSGNFDGGNATLVAFADSPGGSSGGTIATRSLTTLEVQGRGTGTNGDVLFIAEAGGGAADSITTGGITVSGATQGSGSLILKVATPNTGSAVSIDQATGALTNSFDGGTIRNGAISAGALTAPGVPVVVMAGNNITTGSLSNTTTVTTGGSLIVLSGRNIVVTGNTVRTDSSQNGMNMVLIAGASFTDDGTDVTVTGRSGLGGSIDLSAVTTTLASKTTASSGNFAGGNTTMIAFADSAGGTTGGSITLAPAVTLGSGGKGTSDNGDVTIIAEAASGSTPAISAGHITTSGGAAGTGHLTVKAATPDTSVAPVISRAGGGITGSFDGGAVRSGSISAGNLTTHAVNVSLSTGTDIAVASLTGIGSAVNFLAGRDVSATILDNDAVLFTGTLNLIAGRDITVTGATIDNRANTGGNIVMVAGAAFSDDGSNITITGRSGLGGSISAVNATSFTTAALTATSSLPGGNITLVAFADAAGGTTGGAIATRPATTMSTEGGSTGGVNGDVVIIAEAAAGAGNSISTGLIDTARGVLGTGSILLSVATPDTASTPTIARASGAVTGSFAGGDLQVGAVSASALTTGNSPITVNAGGGYATAGSLSAGTAAVTIKSPSLTATVNALSITASSTSIDASSFNSGFTLTSPDASAFTITASGGGAIDIIAAAGQPIAFAKSAGAGITTINLNGGAVTVSGGSISVNPGVTLVSNNVYTFNANGGTFTNSGVIRSSASGNSITVQSDGALGLAGTGLYDQTNAVKGTTSFLAFGAGGSISVAAGSVLTIQGGTTAQGGPVKISTRSLTFGSGASIVATGSATVFTIDSGGAASDLEFVAPDNATASISSAGGAINVSATAGRSIFFRASGSAGQNILRFSGGAVTLDGTAADLGIESGVTVLSDSNTQLLLKTGSLTLGAGAGLEVTGSGSVLINTGAGTTDLEIVAPDNAQATITTVSGQVTITGASGQAVNFVSAGHTGPNTLRVNGGPLQVNSTTGGISIDDDFVLLAENDIALNVNNGTLTDEGTITSLKNAGSITIQSTGSLVLAGTPGPISVTGGGAATITVSAGGGNTLNLNANYVFDPGAGGTLVFGAAGAGGLIEVPAGFILEAPGGGPLSLNAGLVVLNDGAVVRGASVSMTPATPLEIRLPDDGEATIEATAGSIVLGHQSTSGLSVSFTRINGTGPAALSLDGGAVTITATSSTITIDSGVTVAAEDSLTFVANNSTFVNNGQVSSAAANTITVQTNGTVVVGGTGSFAQLNASPGATNFLTTSASGSITFQSGASLGISNGGDVVISTPRLIMGADAVLAAIGASNISINTGALTTALTIEAPQGNSSATIETAGGTIEVTPAAGQGVTFTRSSGSGTGTINLDGGLVEISTDGANITVAANTTLATDSTTMFETLNGGTLTNNGKVVAVDSPLLVEVDGDLFINGDWVSPGGEIRFMSSGNITANTGTPLLDTSTLSGDGGLIFLYAGMGSALGGNVNVTNAVLRSGSDAGIGGDIIIVAQGGTANAGNVIVRSVETRSIDDAGNVLLLANGVVGTANLIGSAVLDTSSINGNAGDVTIISGFEFTAAGETFTLTTPKPEGGNVTVPTLGSSQLSIFANATGAGSSGDGGDITIVAPAGTTFPGRISQLVSFDSNSQGGRGGDILLLAGETIEHAPNVIDFSRFRMNSSTGSTAGDRGGNVVALAGMAFEVVDATVGAGLLPTFRLTGASTSGGNVVLQHHTFTTSSASGDGGHVVLAGHGMTAALPGTTSFSEISSGSMNGTTTAAGRGGDVVLLSTQNIFGGTGAGTNFIRTSSDTAQSGSVSVVAGFDFAADASLDVVGADNVPAFRLSGPSSLGGRIDFRFLFGPPPTEIYTSSTSGDAGDVLLIARGLPNGSQGGVVAMVTVDASSGSGNGGNITAAGTQRMNILEFHPQTSSTGGGAGTSAGNITFVSGFDLEVSDDLIGVGAMPTFSLGAVFGGITEISGVPINASSAGGTSGNVTIVAQEGALNNGAATGMLDINVSTQSGTAGNITVLGSRDVTVSGIHGPGNWNTSSQSGNSGDITAIAGFHLSPLAGAEVVGADHVPHFQVGSPSSAGGLMGLGAIGPLNTSSQGGNAGDVTLVVSPGFSGPRFVPGCFGFCIVQADDLFFNGLNASSADGFGGRVMVLARYNLTINGSIDTATGSLTGGDGGTVSIISGLDFAGGSGAQQTVAGAGLDTTFFLNAGPNVSGTGAELDFATSGTPVREIRTGSATGRGGDLNIFIMGNCNECLDSIDGLTLIDTSSQQGSAGDVRLLAGWNIRIDAVNTSSQSTSGGGAGDLMVVTGFTAEAEAGSEAFAAGITPVLRLTGDDASRDPLIQIAASVNASAVSGDGGSVLLVNNSTGPGADINDEVTVKVIDTSSQGGNAGSISVLSTTRVEVDLIGFGTAPDRIWNATSESGNGGNIQVLSGFNVAPGSGAQALFGPGQVPGFIVEGPSAQGGTIDMGFGASVPLPPPVVRASVDVSSVDGDAGSIVLAARNGNFRASLTFITLDAMSVNGNGGNVAVFSDGFAGGTFSGSTHPPRRINTSSDFGRGGDVTIVAGINPDLIAGSDTFAPGGSLGFSFETASTFGGGIALRNSQIATSPTDEAGKLFQAGNVTLVSVYDPLTSATGAGLITFNSISFEGPNALIKANSNNGPGGNVQIINSGRVGSSSFTNNIILNGYITTDGSEAGKIGVFLARPSAVTGGPAVTFSGGALSGGDGFQPDLVNGLVANTGRIQFTSTDAATTAVSSGGPQDQGTLIHVAGAEEVILSGSFITTGSIELESRFNRMNLFANTQLSAGTAGAIDTSGKIYMAGFASDIPINAYSSIGFIGGIRVSAGTDVLANGPWVAYGADIVVIAPTLELMGSMIDYGSYVKLYGHNTVNLNFGLYVSRYVGTKGGGIEVSTGLPLPTGSRITSYFATRDGTYTILSDPAIEMPDLTVYNDEFDPVVNGRLEIHPCCGGSGYLNFFGFAHIDGGILIVDDRTGTTITAGGADLRPLAPLPVPPPPPPHPPAEPPPLVQVPPDPPPRPNVPAVPQPKNDLIPTDTTREPNPPVVIPPTVCQPMTVDGGSVPSTRGNQQLSMLEGRGGQRYFVSAGSCQPFVLERDDDSMVISTGGTKFSPMGKRTLLLKDGKMVAMASKKSLAVVTSQGEVSVPAESSTIVEETVVHDRAVVRVANLAGDAANVTLRQGAASETLSAAPGEELIIADAALGDEELIPVDGVDRQLIEGAVSVQVEGRKVRRSKFRLDAMAQQESLLLCTYSCFPRNIRGRVAKLRDQLMIAGTAPAISKAGSSEVARRARSERAGKLSQSPGRSLVPVAYRHAAGAAPAAQLMSLVTSTSTLKYLDDSRVELAGEGVVRLRSGDVLVAPTRATLVQSGACKVSARGGAVVLVSRSGDVVKVRNMAGDGSDAVTVYAWGRSMTVPAGRELIVGPSHRALKAELGSDNVGRRAVEQVELADGKNIHRCDFSIVSLIQDSDLLNRLVFSDAGSDREVARKMLKTAACVNHVTAKRGHYGKIR